MTCQVLLRLSNWASGTTWANGTRQPLCGPTIGTKGFKYGLPLADLENRRAALANDREVRRAG